MRPFYFFTDKLLAATVIKLLPRALTPNWITVFRFLTVPIIFWLLASGHYVAAGFLFAFSAFTDALDGALARTSNQVTDWGKLFDPLADKLLIGATAAMLVTKFLSFWLAVAIVSVELLLVLFAYYHKYYRHRQTQANYLGKTKMALQSFGLVSLFIAIIFNAPNFLQLADDLLITALLFAVLSLFGYRSI